MFWWTIPQRTTTEKNSGFAGKSAPWRQAMVDVDTKNEIWADQFLGWVFNTWEKEYGRLSRNAEFRSDFMNDAMKSLNP